MTTVPDGTATVTAYDIDGVRPGTHLAAPSPSLTLIIDLGDGLELTGPALPDRTTFSVCLAGMHRTPFLVHHDGLQRGVQVQVPPSLIRALTGIPAAELGGGGLELAHLAPKPAAELHQRVAAAPSARREIVAAQVLARWAGSHRAVQPDAAHAWALLRARAGQVTVAELVERSGWSAGYLSTRFASEFGMGIKQAARLMRFDAARRALDAGRRAAEAAARCGYADQAHLSREVRQFLGMSPSAYLARRTLEFEPV